MNRTALHSLLLLGAVGIGFSLGYLHTSRHSGPARRVLYYVDPMHPAFRSARPGIAPDCGMQLVPVYADSAADARADARQGGSGRVRIDPAAQQLYGIRLARVTRDSGQRVIRVFGRVAADETRVYNVNMGTDGYIKETHDDAVGDQVRKNQRLAALYSPDFLPLIGGYLSANERTVRDAGGQATASQNAASAVARADRLRDLGMSEAQIAEIAATRKIPEDVYVVSPADGFILSRNISPGQHYGARTDLYTIADLRQVWIIAEVFGADARPFTPGASARVTVPDTGESLAAHVSDVLPEIDPVTRAYKVRLVAQNPRFALRPDLYVDVELPISLASGITVPAEALLDSGLTRRVFVATADGTFEPREVQTGWRLQDRVQIVKGLEQGETIAASGTFLIDSESRLDTPTASLPVASAHSAGSGGSVD